MKTIILTLAIGLLGFQVQGQNPPASQSPADRDSQSQSRMQSARALNSEAASDLLMATGQARNALRSQDKADAQTHIDHALQNADEILSRSQDQYVPIYSELSQYSVIAPIMSARNSASTDNANRQQMRNGQRGQTEQPLPSNEAERSADDNSQARTQSRASNQSGDANRSAQPAGHPTVDQVVGEYTSVNLDVKAAQEHLQAAKAALNQGDLQKADAALRAVDDMVSVETIATDLPLLRARQNLMLARQSAIDGNTQEAQAALRAASDALGNYEQSFGNRNSQVGQVRSQIDRLSQSGQQLGQNAASQIEGFWNQISSWITQQTPRRG